jgi:hypothetical protein
MDAGLNVLYEQNGGRLTPQIVAVRNANEGDS